MTVFSRYGRYKLPSEYKKVYDAVTGAIEKREIQVQVEAIPREAIRLIWQALEIDNPQFYYVKFDSWSALRSDTSCTLLIEYTIPLEEQHMLDQKLAAICSFLKRKAVGKNQKETAQILHDWLVYQRKYGEYEGKTETANNILGSLIYGEAVCEGYAKTYKYLCDALKLRCMVVHGTAKSSVNGKEEGHAWNVVRVDGNFYHVDVTFDLCIENEYISRFYFLLSDKECMFDHSAGEASFPPPDCRISGSTLSIVNGTDALIQFLEKEYRAGAAYSEVRLSKRFSEEKMKSMIESHRTEKNRDCFHHLDYYSYKAFDHRLLVRWKT